MKKIFIIFVILLFANLSFATTYYVATTGNDSNDGSESLPWLTLQHAADTVTAGDIVIVKDGTYTAGFTITTDGTSSNYITFKGETNQGAYITTSSLIIGTTSNKASYIKVDGLKIEKSWVVIGDYNILTNCLIVSGGAKISWHPDYPSSTACIVSNNIFTTTGTASDLPVIINTGRNTTNCVIENNTFKDVEGTDLYRGFGTGHIFRNNEVYGLDELGQHSDLFQVYSNNGEWSNDILIESNYFHDCTGSMGMMENSNSNLNISDWIFRNNLFVNVNDVMQVNVPYFKFYNNTFINCGHNTVGPILLRNLEKTQNGYEWPHNTTIKNNIFVGCGINPDGDNGWYHWGDGLSSSYPGINFTADHNYVTTSKSDGYQSKTSFGSDETTYINGGDPKFIDYDSKNFKLQSISPAIDYGETIATFSDDYNGVTRPQGSAWDIGAYEYLFENHTFGSGPTIHWGAGPTITIP